MRHLQKISIFLICSLYVLVCHSLLSKQVKKEKIISLINELTPTHSINKSFENIDIIGFDVCDESQNRLASSKFEFSPRSQFYLVLYCRKNRIGGISPTENKLRTCKAVFEHQNGGYFWSKKTVLFLGEHELKNASEEWQIGGIYKIRFNFKVPEFSLPGKYILKIVKEKSVNPWMGKSITFDKIKINIKSQKAHNNRKIEDYNLSLEGCLLNPAVLRDKRIIFPWTGNIVFFIDKDIKNFKKIIITAKGTPAFGVYPLLKIFVDQEEIGSLYVNSEWNEYEFYLKLNKESHVLKVRFDNDTGRPGEDRNMFIHMIKLMK